MRIVSQDGLGYDLPESCVLFQEDGSVFFEPIDAAGERGVPHRLAVYRREEDARLCIRDCVLNHPYYYEFPPDNPTA